MRQDRIDYLKAFSAFFVVLGHAFLKASSDMYPVLEATNRLIYSFHVPLFLVISGYLCHRQPFGAYIKKKLKYIIVPYLFFALLKLIFAVLVSKAYMHGESLAETAVHYFLLGDAYWFPYCIFLMFLLMFFFWQDGPPVRAAVACVILTALDAFLAFSGHALFPAYISLSGMTLTDPCRELSLLLHYFPYFLAGYIIRYYSGQLRLFYENHRKLLLTVSAITAAGFVVLWSLGIMEDNQFFDFIPGCAVMLLLFALTQRLPAGVPLLKEAGSVSYQIMLLDSLFKTLLFAIAARLTGISEWLVLPITVIDVFLCILVCRTAVRLPTAAFLLGLRRDE